MSLTEKHYKPLFQPKRKKIEEVVNIYNLNLKLILVLEEEKQFCLHHQQHQDYCQS